MFRHTRGGGGWWLCLALVASAASAGEAVRHQVLWRGTSGGLQWRWTTADLQVQADGQTLRLFRPRAEREWQAFQQENRAEISHGGATFEKSEVPLSVVGPYVSFEETDFASAGSAPPTLERRFVTWRVTPSGAQPVSLLDLFPEAAVLAALLADEVVQAGLKSASAPAPTSLADLVHALQGQALHAPEDECDYSFTPDLASRFAFHHLEGPRVAVRLSLPPLSPTCRTQLSQLGLRLPISSALALPLHQAAARQAGFLMKQQKPLPKAPRTKNTFTTGLEAKPSPR